MSVPEQIPYVGYVANGQTTEFPITFDLHDPEYLIVTVNKEIPVVGTYTVDMNALKVVFATAPTDGTQVELYRETELNRDTNYQKYDNSFRPEAVNYDFDKIWHVLQEQDMIDAELLARLKAEIEWRRTHDANFDELAKMRDAQVFSGLKQYIDTFIAASNPNIFEGITAGIVFALDKKSVQTHLEDIYQQLNGISSEFDTRLSDEVERATAAEQGLSQSIQQEVVRATAAEAQLQVKVDSIAGGASYGYTSYSEMVAAASSIPAHSIVTVGGDPDTTKDGDYIYNGSTFSKSPYDPLTQAKNYTDTFSSLTRNSTVFYPFSTRKRNNIVESTVSATHTAYLKPYILSIRVMNANKDQYYRVQQISNPDHATAANRWIFEVLARTSFDTAETSIKTIPAVLPIVKNTGIRTYLVEDGDVKIAITLDTNKCPAFDFYSVASTDSSYTYIIDPSLYFYAAVGSSDLAVINKRIDGFIKPMQLQNLLKDLRNPIQSVQINLIGDSITYGYGATDNGAGPTPPHGPATTKTWANSVRDYLGTAFCTSERFDDTILETGEAYYTSDGTSVLSAELSNFTFKNSATGKEFTIAEMQALVGILPTSPVGTYIDLRSPSLTSVIAPTDMEFLFNGNGFTINHARLSNGSATESIIDVFVNDVLHSSFNVYSATPDFLGKHEVSDLVDGPKKIRISNRLTNTLIYARLLSITATRKISVINNGVSGSNTGSWLTGNWIPDRISNKDNYVIVMLGTNDRHTTQKIGTFKNNYVQLLDRISVKNPKAQIIVMSPPAVTQSEDPSTGRLFRIADLNYALSQIAQLKSVSFISLFEATSKLKAQGTLFLADQLHPNDYGYGVIAEYIINQILNA
ncbi:phage tail fiber protein [Acinetobacter baumannii]|uniref:phage tail fiber domain-containing protein n=2 Tax=Acinetobacter baumannii TaxID=470 RepID=UPI000E9E3BB7|nr:phage tail fiber protein [Acinetobacter baumannii]AXX53929.1 lipase [Acinetobacter baumannii]